jgi:AcrR family transcriptional regulator
VKTKQKRKEQHQRERIIRAAAKALSRKGYSDVTVDEFAQAMKSTKGTIYYYFPSKADILYELHSRLMELGYTSLKQVVEENDLPPLER